MFKPVYKWYLVSSVRRCKTLINSQCQDCQSAFDTFPGGVIYDEGIETSDIEKCVTEGFNKFNDTDFPDSMGCNLILHVKRAEEV